VTRATLVLAVAAVALAGCAHLSAADRGPRGDPMARLQVTGPSPWRDDLGDAVLADLLRQADAGALDNRIALAKAARADADVESATAALRPIAAIGAAGAVGGSTFRRATTAVTPTAEARWEVDLWGRAAHSREAARAERGATLDEVEAARLLTAAETVRAYGALRIAQAAEAAAARRADLARTALSLTRARAAEGAATDQAVSAARRAADAAEGDRQQAHAEAELQTARLGDLVGRRDLTVAPAPAPVVDAVPAVTSAVVDRRPDVRAAYARLTAADARRAAAIAAARPEFAISAALGAPDAAIATLLDVKGLAWAIAGAATQQVIDGGARRAEVHATTADADLADLTYRKTVLGAWQDVRAALAAQAEADRRLDLAEGELAAARTARAMGATRHAQGAADGLALAALGAQEEAAADTVRAARGAALEARVQLRLATGGA